MQLEFEVGDKVRVTNAAVGLNGEYTVAQVIPIPTGERRYNLVDDNGSVFSAIPERWLSPALLPMKDAITRAVDALAAKNGVKRVLFMDVESSIGKTKYALSEVARKLAENSYKVEHRERHACTCTGWQLLHRGHLDTCPGRDG